jgi:hypothetical protein
VEDKECDDVEAATDATGSDLTSDESFDELAVEEDADEDDSGDATAAAELDTEDPTTSGWKCDTS